MDSLPEDGLTLEAPLRVPLERVLVSKPNDESIPIQTGPLCGRYTVLIAAQRGYSSMEAQARVRTRVFHLRAMFAGSLVPACRC